MYIFNFKKTTISSTSYLHPRLSCRLSAQGTTWRDSRAFEHPDRVEEDVRSRRHAGSAFIFGAPRISGENKDVSCCKRGEAFTSNYRTNSART